MAEQKPKHYISDIPELMAEWNWGKNNELGLDPSKITSGSGKKVWWKCSNEHEWQAVIASRNNGRGCPYCSGRYVIKGENDLQTVNPTLAKEWNYKKNNELTPADVLPGSNKKVWWKCSTCGYEWQTSVAHRTNGRNCPHCSHNKTSLPELTLLYYMRKYSNVNVIHRYNELGCEIDIFIPDLNIGIEYDGHYWHKDKLQRDLAKNQILNQYGITLYRVREAPLSELNSTSIDISYHYSKPKEFEQVITKLISQIFHLDIDIDFNNDRIELNNLSKMPTIKESIIVTHPQLLLEWNYIKNNKLKPDYLTSGSNKKVWWTCSKCGHEWLARIADRCKGTQCPQCRTQLQAEKYVQFVIQSKGSLADIYPEIAKEWHPTKNGHLKPTDVTSNSHQKVWWKCNQCGHEWYTFVYSRVRGCGCPKCSYNKVHKIENRLHMQYPEIAKEWHPTKNGHLQPHNVGSRSRQKVWWKCSICGYEWQTQVRYRTMYQAAHKGCRNCRTL